MAGTTHRALPVHGRMPAIRLREPCQARYARTAGDRRPSHLRRVLSLECRRHGPPLRIEPAYLLQTIRRPDVRQSLEQSSERCLSIGGERSWLIVSLRREVTVLERRSGG